MSAQFKLVILKGHNMKTIFNTNKALLLASVISGAFVSHALAEGQYMGGPSGGDPATSVFSVNLSGGSGGAFQVIGTGENLDRTTTFANGMKMGETDMSFDFSDPNFCKAGTDCPEEDAALSVNFDSYEKVMTESGAATDLSGNQVTSGQQLQASSGGGFSISDGHNMTGFEVMGNVALGSQSIGSGSGDEVSVQTHNSALIGAASNFSLDKAAGECILCESVDGSGGIYGMATNGGTVTASSHTPGQVAKATNQNFTQIGGAFNADFFSGAVNND